MMSTWLFYEILKTAGYEEASHTLDRDEVFVKVRELLPDRLEEIEAQRKANGQTTRWQVTPTRIILEWVSGLELLLRFNPPLCFGYSVTCDPAQVSKKQERLRATEPLWRSIGIQKAGVVLFIPPEQQFTWNQSTFVWDKEWPERLMDQVIYATDESPQETIRCYTLAV